MGLSSQVLWKQPWNSDAESTLREALSNQRCSIHELSSQTWDSNTLSIGGVRDTEVSFVAPSSAEWSSLRLHHSSFIGESLAAELSRLNDCPAIVMLEYDQDTWGYSLFDRGQLVDRFWSVPDAVDTPPEECAGNSEVVSSVFGVPNELVNPYIRHITEADLDSKGFDDDEFVLGNHWVRVDFMRRLGLSYPSPGQTAGGRYVKIDEL